MLGERVQDWRRVWQQEWLEEGQKQGEAALLLRQLELRFGPLNESARSRVRDADAETLLRWGERVLTAATLADVFGG